MGVRFLVSEVPLCIGISNERPTHVHTPRVFLATSLSGRTQRVAISSSGRAPAGLCRLIVDATVYVTAVILHGVVSPDFWRYRHSTPADLTRDRRHSRTTCNPTIDPGTVLRSLLSGLGTVRVHTLPGPVKNRRDSGLNALSLCFDAKRCTTPLPRAVACG